MPIIERPDLLRTRRYAPPALKLLLLVAVILGFWLRSCWYSKQDVYYEFSDIELENRTMSSVDVLFVVTNATRIKSELSILITLYTDRGDVLASRITTIEVQPRSRRRYRKMMEKWARPLYEGEDLGSATVEIYKPAIL